MTFLDNNLQKITAFKMYRTNILWWYARVGNDKALIDTTESPSIQTAEYNDSRTISPSPVYDTQNSNNNDVITMVIQDTVTATMFFQSDQKQHTAPQIHSSMAWTDAPPLLQRSDTCSESDSDDSEDSSHPSTTLPDTAIPIFITAEKKSKVYKKPLVPNQSNSKRRYYIHGSTYWPCSTLVQQEFQRMINVLECVWLVRMYTHTYIRSAIRIYDTILSTRTRAHVQHLQ